MIQSKHIRKFDRIFKIPSNIIVGFGIEDSCLGI